MKLKILFINHKQFNLFTFLVLFVTLSCTNKDKYAIPTDLMPVKKFSTLDVCGCNKQARIILDQSIELRMNYSDMKSLKKDVQAVSNVRFWAKRWTNLMQSCFMTNGGKMWDSDDCNNQKLIEEKKNNLYNLGIHIDQGEKVRL